MKQRSEAELVATMSETLVAAARPEKIILFGSRAEGTARRDSDFDILVVEKAPQQRHLEMVRLSRLLRVFDVSVDLLVVSEEKYRYWKDTPGNVYHDAESRGRVLYEAV